MTHVFNVKDYGAVGDGRTDDITAFQNAISQIEALSSPASTSTRPSSGAILFIPQGTYLLSRTLHIYKSITIKGTGGLSNNSRLLFHREGIVDPEDQHAGIIIHGENTPEFRLGSGSIIQDISVTTHWTYNPAVSVSNRLPEPAEEPLLERNRSGIIIHAAYVKIEGCSIVGFPHDGIHITSAVESGSNSDNWMIVHCYVGSNGRNGLYVGGGSDNHAGTCIGLAADVNYQWGILDRGFLGNTYVGCVAHPNGHTDLENPAITRGGGVCLLGANARHVWIGGYIEAGQRNRIEYPSIAIGGNISGENWERLPGARAFPTFLANEGDFQTARLIAH